MLTTTITVAPLASLGGDASAEREEVRTIHVNQEGARYFYLPDHIGEDVMTSKGYARVIAVTDHECTGLAGCGNTCGGKHLSDECCVEEIDLPDYTEDA